MPLRGPARWLRTHLQARRKRGREWIYPTTEFQHYHLSLAFAGQAIGTYIDVGAGHPIADNVSFWFYERGWQGIIVEPQPELAALYQRLRPRDLAFRGLVGRHAAKWTSMWSNACMGS